MNQQLHTITELKGEVNKMPHISIEGPVIEDLEKKRILAKEITEAATKAYGLPKETIIVAIKENSPENVSVGGQLIVDRFQQDPSKSS